MIIDEFLRLTFFLLGPLVWRLCSQSRLDTPCSADKSSNIVEAHLWRLNGDKLETRFSMLVDGLTCCSDVEFPWRSAPSKSRNASEPGKDHWERDCKAVFRLDFC